MVKQENQSNDSSSQPKTNSSKEENKLNSINSQQINQATSASSASPSAAAASILSSSAAAAAAAAAVASNQQLNTIYNPLIKLNPPQNALNHHHHFSQFANHHNQFHNHPDMAASLASVANHIVAAAAASDVGQHYFQGQDLSNAYKLPAAAVHLMQNSSASASGMVPSSLNSSNSVNISNMSTNSNSSTNSSSSGGSRDRDRDRSDRDRDRDRGDRGGNGGEEIHVEETTRKREMRLLKNREAARECRRKKKEYIKCLENRVAVLENQNKTLIDELKSLKELYCQTDGPQNH